ncbi:hypothetical protein [Marinigracilibium pacificum]|uniref:Uncharacterized protein n=1 Tax=Marinigracilibium pacificum TaxID=2729599 RepID=A0A848J3D9_9BACT|nr:hypothetical protein [Marinigracilibium pacificum]NMM47692.1 hypothetical protein [Marinigracilibium pacificum]
MSEISVSGNSFKRNIFRYIIEFIIVAFGVFLGTYLNDMESKKQEIANQEKALKNIITELENNQQNLQKTINYHELIKVNFDSLLKTIPEDVLSKNYFENKSFKFVYIKDWVGNGFTEFEDTAFEVSKMSGTLQNMDIELIQEISKVYNKINSQSEFQSSINNRMTSLNSQSTTYDVIGNIIILTRDNLGMEKMLSKQLDQSIKNIREMQYKEAG